MHRGAALLGSGRAAVASALVFALLGAGCHRRKHYTTNVEVARVSTVRTDQAGQPLTLDLELVYSECPGTQIEVIRAGADLARCVSKLKVGERVKVELDHEWAGDGHYRWAIRMIGDCARVPDPDDGESYSMVRECEDWVINGTRVGFRCNYLPEKKLVAACPWFERR